MYSLSPTGRESREGVIFSMLVCRVRSCIDRDGVIQGKIRYPLHCAYILFEWRHNAALNEAAPGDSIDRPLSVDIHWASSDFFEIVQGLPWLSTLFLQWPWLHIADHVKTLRYCGWWDAGTSPRLKHCATVKEPCFEQACLISAHQ